jgi:CheY-like chemotaxis protein
MSPTDRKFVIVIVEDNAGDVFLVREALDEAAFPHALHVITNGAQAVDFLRQMGTNGGGPDLVILDLNLPGKTGRQIMAEMETAADLRALPVAILTTSRSESQIGKEFPRLRTTFAAKTPDFRQLVEIIRRFKEFARQPLRPAP